MKALVTGGAGFIGSNLVDALLARGDEVTVVDDLSTGRRENLDGALAAGATLVEADIRDARRAEQTLAAESGPRPSSTWPPRSTCASRSPTPPSTPRSTSAAPPTCSRRRAAAGSRRFVFVSTGGAIYGEGEGKELPLAEDAPIAPMLRLRPEQVRRPRATWRSTSGSTASPASRLRLGNVYGPRQDPLGEAGVIAIFCGQLRERRTADRVRRRHADPRLHICGRRGRGGAGRGASRRRRAGQHRHRDRDRRAGAGRAARRAGRRRELRARARARPHRRGAADLDRPGPRRARARLERRRRASKTACASPSTRSDVQG